LGDGKPRKASEIYKLAEEQNFSIRTIKKVKKDIGVKSFLEYDQDGDKLWCWRLPKDDDEINNLFNDVRVQPLDNFAPLHS
jgi:hypothetical protein